MKKTLCFIFALFMITAGCSAKPLKANSSVNNRAGIISSTDTSTSISEQTTSTQCAKALAPFIHINMVSKNSGYAMTKDFHVLKTADGGTNWAEVSIIDNLTSESNGALFALNDEIVYVACYTDSGIEIKKSTDGGNSWSNSLISMHTDDLNSGYGGNLAISFTNQNDGFLLTSSLPSAGMMGKTLYKTSNGGINWTDVNTQGASNFTNIKGYTTGITFFNSGTGYITCTYHGQDEISVYKTTNGMKSWSIAKIQIPEKYTSTYGKNYYADAYPPAVYGESRKDAIMELYFCRGDERSPYIYRSIDGGTTWHLDGISNLLMKEYSFSDDKNGLGLDESGILYTTNNGGILWTKIQ